MSIEVLLIPLGIAAISAIKEWREANEWEGFQATRVTDADLLVRALDAIGATDVVRDGDFVLCESEEFGRLRFHLGETAIVGRVEGAAPEATESMLAAVDAAAGRVSQQQSIIELKARAPQLGLRLVEERVDEDGAIQLLFEEDR